MKNLLTMLGLFALVLCAFSFAGCKEVADELAAPENTWCRLTTEYKNDKGSTSLIVYAFYTDSDIIGDGSMSGYRNGLTIPAGITFVVTTDSDSSANIITDFTMGKYVIKTIGKGSKDSELNLSGSKTGWNALYWSNRDFRVAANQSTTPLGELKSASNELSWDKVKDQLSWKKLLANYLLN